jgi:hypothetical protein
MTNKNNLWFVASLFFCLSFCALPAQAQFDPNYQGYYRLKTQFQGADHCLEGNQLKGDMNGASFMDKCQNVSGQLWKFESAGNGFYRMKTQFRGPKGECLEGNRVKGFAKAGGAFMNKCQNVSGQLWKLEK